MLSRLFLLLRQGLGAIYQHGELWLVVILAVVIPFGLLFVVYRTTTVADSALEQVEIERLDAIHEAIENRLRTGVTGSVPLSVELHALASTSPDLRTLAVATEASVDTLLLVAATGQLSSSVGTVVTSVSERYRTALTLPGEIFVHKLRVGEERVWLTYSAVTSPAGTTYYIHSELSRARFDAALEAERTPIYALSGVHAGFILLCAYLVAAGLASRGRLKEATARLREESLLTSLVVHELRAPLTGIRGYASMIEENSVLPALVRTQATNIKQSSVRLVSLVSDFLEAARLRAEIAPPILAPTDLHSVVKRVVAELAPVAEEKHLTLFVAATEPLPLVMGNEKHLTQIVTNLVGNAIKYTREGRIEVALVDDSFSLELRIKDTGLGMSAADQARLFAPFSRVGDAATQSITGTGLGMWITKLMVEQLGGTIGVESIKGIGTHVVVRFKKAQK